jgi:membrane-bound ClpP family serine protease
MIKFGVLRYGLLSYCCMVLATMFLLLTLGDIIFLVLEIFFIPQSAIIIVLSLIGIVSFILSGFFLYLCAAHFADIYKNTRQEDNTYGD